jgi:hypothetical protein
MKHETTRYVAECDTCRRVEADYMRLAGAYRSYRVNSMSCFAYLCMC